MDKKYLVWGIIIVLVLVVSGYVYYSSQTPKDGIKLEFSSSECTGPNDLFEDEITKTEWVDDTTLEATAHVIINCCNEIGKGNYEIINNKIILKFEDIGKDECDCICDSDLTYTFSDIDKKDYQFELQSIK
jgi:hypothetical protein